MPPYQAAQMILLRLHREGGGPGQRPAREIDAAAEVQVLGLAHGSRGGQGASIRRLGHGWSWNLNTATLSCQETRLRVSGGGGGKEEEGFAMPFGKGSSLKSEARVGWREWNYKTQGAVRQKSALRFLGMRGTAGWLDSCSPRARTRRRGKGLQELREGGQSGEGWAKRIFSLKVPLGLGWRLHSLYKETSDVVHVVGGAG